LPSVGGACWKGIVVEDYAISRTSDTLQLRSTSEALDLLLGARTSRPQMSATAGTNLRDCVAFADETGALPVKS